jgi:CheY-like chemotaxis protein/REP element-mobilizing transposase RayT
VVDPSQEFSDLIRVTLEDAGQFDVSLASSGSEALQMLRLAPPRLAIIDFGLPDVSGRDLVEHLRSELPGLAVIAIPVANDPDDPDLQGLQVEGLLTKPFYLPELPQLVAQALSASERTRSSVSGAPWPGARPGLEASSLPPAPEALFDPETAATLLQRHFVRTVAIAALVTRNHQPWARAGRLSQADVDDLIAFLAQEELQRGSQGALAKFIRLGQPPRDSMVYHHHFAQEYALALLFPSETSFGVIRRQSQRLTGALLDDSLAYSSRRSSFDLDQAGPALAMPPDVQMGQPAESPGWGEDQLMEIAASPDGLTPLPDVQVPSAGSGAELDLSDQLGPQAPQSLPFDHGQPEVPEPSEHSAAWAVGMQASPAPGPSDESDQRPLSEDEADTHAGDPEPVVDLPDDWIPASATPADESDQRPLREDEADTHAGNHEPAVELPDDWIPSSARPAESLPFLEAGAAADPAPAALSTRPLPAASFYLPISTVLIPRVPDHRLAPQVAEHLRRWVERLCLAWDWRADLIVIQPEHMLLTIALSSDIAPARAIDQLCRELSARMIKRAPSLLADLPSGQFWSSSYLMVAGPPPDRATIHAFIDQVRQAQQSCAD